jgi:hypothetical protein
MGVNANKSNTMEQKLYNRIGCSASLCDASSTRF